MNRMGMVRVSIFIAALVVTALDVGIAPVLGEDVPSRSGTGGAGEKTSNPKLESRLDQLSRAAKVLGSAGAEAVAGSAGIELETGRVRVIALAHDGDTGAVTEAARAARGRVEGVYDDLVQVSVVADQLDAFAADPGVEFVRLPNELQPQGSVQSEGVELINASTWHDAGFTGDGVRVAIFDTGFEGYEALLGTELPDSVETHSCVAGDDISGGGDPHGTAVAEIVHDIAPDAELVFANAHTEVEFGSCVNWLTGQNIDVVNFSAGVTMSGPGDGTGPYNDAVEDITDDGVLWVNAAGNYAQQHWAGSWIDAEDDGWMDFVADDNYNRIQALAGDEIRVAIRWDDTWGRSCNDYDLLLLDAPDGSIVADSSTAQDCKSEFESFPMEQLSYVAPADGTYYVVIERFIAEGFALFDLFSLNDFHTCPDSLQYCSPGRSIVQPADNEQALAVGAVGWDTPDEIEIYSSRGPTEDNRTKPELVAPDRVGTTTFGTDAPGFEGTSAAAPHVSGAAALLKQADSSRDRVALRSYFLANAEPLGGPGVDNIFGYGRVMLDDPPGGQPTATATAAPSTMTPTQTPQATGTPAEDTPTPTSTEQPATDTPVVPTGTPVPPTATVTASATNTATPGSEFDLGDGNCDGAVNSLDAALALQLTAGLLEELFCGDGDVDVDGDGSEDAIDAALILQYDAGLIDTLPAGGAAGNVTAIRIGSLEQEIDQVGGVTLEARDMPLPGLGAWTLDVTYDGDIVTPTSCSGLSVSVCNTTYDVDTVRVVGATGSNGFPGNRNLASLNFRCDAEGTSALEITIRVLVDGSSGDPQPIDAAIVNGSVTCSAHAELLGDTNCDGEVNAIDAALILQYTAGLINSVPCPDDADVDGDGDITPVDAALILQYLAGLIDEL